MSPRAVARGLAIAWCFGFVLVIPLDFLAFKADPLAVRASRALRRCQINQKRPTTKHIRRSKSGKARHLVLTEEGIELFSGIAAGRKYSDILLGREWKDTNQVRHINAACERAKINPPITFHGLRHTWASLSVMEFANTHRALAIPRRR